MQRKIITTTDGSHSLFVPELNEHYHSTHGAIQESMHVFIEAGLKVVSKEKTSLNIFEVGFGTGLNALLTCIESEKANLNIHYTSIEAFPLEEAITNELNYANLLSHNGEKNCEKIFSGLHSCEWEKENQISSTFFLTKIKASLQDFNFEEQKFDLIYFDAFGPPVQPEMWTNEIFLKLFNSLNPKGILATYCAKGEVKRTLKNVGFTVESIPGPPGKREMIRAVKAA